MSKISVLLKDKRLYLLADWNSHCILPLTTHSRKSVNCCDVQWWRYLAENFSLLSAEIFRNYHQVNNSFNIINQQRELVQAVLLSTYAFASTSTCLLKPWSIFCMSWTFQVYVTLFLAWCSANEIILAEISSTKDSAIERKVRHVWSQTWTGSSFFRSLKGCKLYSGSSCGDTTRHGSFGLLLCELV